MTQNTIPSIDDVARLAGVSTSTVSRSVNEPHKVKSATLEVVQAAIAELGYTPHFGGRALASNKTNTIGAIIPTMDNAIFARGLQALQETLAEAGVTLLVATSGYDAQREAEQIRALLARGIDGLLLIGVARPQATYDLLKQHHVKVVVAWSYSEASVYPCVGFDNQRAAAMLTEAAMGRGHKRVAMIAGVSDGNDRAAERIDGVRAALQQGGMDLPAEHLIEAPYELQGAMEAMERLMALAPRPTVIICGNDVLAAGALMQARREGFNVPGDVSVVGFDDIELAMAVDPALTTIRVPHKRMGVAAGELLLALRRGDDEVQSRKFETELVVRQSLGPPP